MSSTYNSLWSKLQSSSQKWRVGDLFYRTFAAAGRWVWAGLELDRPPRENLEKLRAELTRRRCLILIEAPEQAVRETFEVGHPGSRASVLICPDGSGGGEAEVQTLEYASQLVRERRFAETYDLLYILMANSNGPDRSHCARELAWICDHWEWHSEAERLRRFDVHAPSRQAGLFE